MVFRQPPWVYQRPRRRLPRGVSAGGTSHTITPAGGLQLGGEVDILHVAAFQAAGGLTFAGAPAITKTKLIDPSGGLTHGSTAPFARVHAMGVSGGLQLGGAAAFTTHSAVHTITPAGGLTFNGAAPWTIPSLDVFSPVQNVVRAVVKNIVFRPDRDDDGSGDFQE